jgi:hypothetical protein
METNERFRNIGQSISRLDSTCFGRQDKISKLEKAVAHNIQIKVVEINKMFETIEEKHGMIRVRQKENSIDGRKPDTK